MQILIINILQNHFNTLKVHISASFQQKTAPVKSRFQQLFHKMQRATISPATRYPDTYFSTTARQLFNGCLTLFSVKQPLNSRQTLEKQSEFTAPQRGAWC